MGGRDSGEHVVDGHGSVTPARAHLVGIPEVVLILFLRLPVADDRLQERQNAVMVEIAGFVVMHEETERYDGSGDGRPKDMTPAASLVEEKRMYRRLFRCSMYNEREHLCTTR